MATRQLLVTWFSDADVAALLFPTESVVSMLTNRLGFRMLTLLRYYFPPLRSANSL